MTNTNIKVRKHYSAIGITDRLKAALATVEWSELSNRQRHFKKLKEGKSLMKKYSYLICALFLNGTIALAQSTPVQNRQLSSGVVGIAPGQTARWNVLYPTAPAPILQPICSVDLSVADDQGNILKTASVSQFTAGRTVSVDLNSDTDLAGKPRTQIHAYAVAPDGCNLTATLELIDNTSQKTVLVVGSKQTYPVMLCSAFSGANASK